MAQIDHLELPQIVATSKPRACYNMQKGAALDLWMIRFGLKAGYGKILSLVN